MNILVTGCNGQLGNEIQLLEKCYDNHTFFNTDVQELDITNTDAVNRFVEDNKIDGIINCAAYTAVDRAESDIELCTLINTDAPGILAAAIEQRNGWLVQISTDYVFDGKAQQECSKTMIIRTAWLYSTFGNNFVKTMLRLGKERDSLNVIFDQVGTPTYARDLAAAILIAVDKGVIPGIYHFSNEGVISWYDFTKAIHRIAGITDCDVKPIHTAEYPTPAERPHYSVLDKTKIKKTYDITIPYWEESLKSCIQELQHSI